MKKYNQIRAMLSITRASFRSTTRSPSAVVFSLLFPLIFILVFGFIGNNSGVHVHVALDNSSDTMNTIYASMKQNPTIRFYNENDSEQVKELKQGDLDAIAHIEKDSAGYVVSIKTSDVSVQNGQLVKGLINQIIGQQNMEAMKQIITSNIAGVMPHFDMPFRMKDQPVIHGREYKTIDFILPGQLGFSLLSTGVFGTAFVFLNLRQTLVIKRFFATPIKRPYIVVGEALSRIFFGLIGAAFILSIGHFAFGFTLIHGFTTFLTLMLLAALGLIIFMGFGFVVSGLAKNEGAVPPLANIITLPQFLLSGTFFSTSNFPSWLQPISKALPLTYLNEAMRKVSFEGAGFSGISYDLLILGIWGVIVYALATKLFRWE